MYFEVMFFAFKTKLDTAFISDIITSTHKIAAERVGKHEFLQRGRRAVYLINPRKLRRAKTKFFEDRSATKTP